MQTVLSLPYETSDAIPDHVDSSDDVRMPEPLVEHVVEAFTESGATVLDPFAGFGTTLAVAEELGRIPYGVEFDADRVAFARDRLGRDDAADHLVHGDAFDLDWSAFPAVDLCLTSPPFIAWSEGIDPFRNYDPDSETTYERYLDDIERLFSRVARCMAADATLVVEVANLKTDDGVFPLAWDVGERLAETVPFDFRGETVVAWEGEEREDGEGVYGYGYDHSYCLVYDVDSE